MLKKSVLFGDNERIGTLQNDNFLVCNLMILLDVILQKVEISIFRQAQQQPSP
jgi:hypothetical protein